MKKLLLLFNHFLLYGGVLLVLFTPFALDDQLANGIISGKIGWFHLSMLCLAGGTCLSIIIRPSHRFVIDWSDGFIFLLAGIVLITYQWKLNPEPEKLLFGGQLICLWFILKYLFTNYPRMCLFFFSILLITGVLEAVLGIMQLCGYIPSYHVQFRLTGSFFNPGPYCGYLAMIFPISVGLILRLHKQSRLIMRVPYYLAWGSLLLIILVLPSGMSRSAWIATVISGGWVYWIYRVGWKKTKDYWRKRLIQGICVLCIVVGISCIGGYGIYQIKKDSAKGRWLVWKVTTLSICRQPFKGVGLGGFPAAYAKTQADYFATGKVNEIEKKIAGCPEYAFNEYLQICVEEGIPGAMIFIIWLGCCFYSGIKNKQYEMSGGLLALSIFSLSSYPLQLPSFWIVLIFLTASISIKPLATKIRTYPLFFIIGVSLFCFGMQKDYYRGYKKWNKVKSLYYNKMYETAKVSYVHLYPLFNHNPEFLFEGAQCLSKSGEVEKSISWLKHAVQLSADPMLYYVMARNEQALGKYKEAEQHLLYAIDIVPHRYYPYYLLAKLYAEPAFFQPEKRDSIANIVLTNKPKVESLAIKQMRNEMQKILKDTFISPANITVTP